MRAMIGTKTPVTEVRRRVPPKIESAIAMARIAPMMYGVESLWYQEYEVNASATLNEASRLKPPM